MPEPRIFTLEEAERALPLVRRIVADIRAAYADWVDAVSRYELEVASVQAGDEEPELLAALRTTVTERAERVAALVAELEPIGCELKDFRLGLVDFYALREDRLVYLCWRAGEAGITHWHELDAGFAGRQPIDHPLFSGTVP